MDLIEKQKQKEIQKKPELMSSCLLVSSIKRIKCLNNISVTVYK